MTTGPSLDKRYPRRDGREAGGSAIVVGGGHNGLVTAGYLARAGLPVLVLERRELVGGACVTEETFPGFKVSTAAYVNSLFRKEIVRDLRPGRPRLRGAAAESVVLHAVPGRPVPHARARTGRSTKEIAKFSARDAERYPDYEAMLERVADLVEPTITHDARRTCCGRGSPVSAPFSPWAGASAAWAAAPRRRWTSSTGAARDRSWTAGSSPSELKSTLATDAIIGAMASPSMPGTAYVLFHHVMGETNGQRGVWGYVRGGMGGLTQALARRPRAPAASEIRCEAEVARILVRDGRVTGVALASGDEFQAPVVASNADAHVTFTRLLDPRAAARGVRGGGGPDRLRERLAQDQRRARRAARFPRAARAASPGPSTAGTIHICPDLDYIERAYDDAKYGRPSARPVLECTIPSVVDHTRGAAGPASHVDVRAVRAVCAARGHVGRAPRAFADRCFALLDEYAPNFSPLRARAPGADPARHRAHVRPHRRQHLPGRDDAEPALLLPAGAGPCATTARPSAASISAAPPPIRAAASWAPPATMRRARSCATPPALGAPLER